VPFNKCERTESEKEIRNAKYKIQYTMYVGRGPHNTEGRLSPPSEGSFGKKWAETRVAREKAIS